VVWYGMVMVWYGFLFGVDESMQNLAAGKVSGCSWQVSRGTR